MVFSSLFFLSVFLPIVLIGYYILPGKLRDAWLFLSSLFFYSWGEPIYVCIMLFSTVFDYANGRLIEHFDAKGAHRTLSRTVMIISVVVNLGILCFFKYTDFLLGSINDAFGLGLPLLSLALPIGISFYTFQTLSYTIDVYRGKVGVQHNIIRFGMYVAMFPQLIAGPIVRYADVARDIEERQINTAKMAAGMQRFLVGLGKKVLLANQAGAAFESLKSYSADESTVAIYWLSALFYTFQIYFDFSGYSDMAIGLGSMLGFSFPENFDHPYESRSVTEFWRRWHMTLGTWFREYLYIPMGGNRVNTGRHILNLLVVWALTGIWHGAGWNFLLWGLFYFVLLVVEKYLLKDVLVKWPAVCGHIYTMLLVIIGWVIFSFDDLSEVIRHLTGLFAGRLTSPLSVYEWTQYIPILVIMTIGCTSFPAKLAAKVFADENKRFVIGAIYSLVLLAVSVVFLVSGSYNPFLYFRF